MRTHVPVGYDPIHDDVSLLALGNAGGRVIAGILSDQIGRTWTLFAVFFFQAVLMFLLRGLKTSVKSSRNTSPYCTHRGECL